MARRAAKSRDQESDFLEIVATAQDAALDPRKWRYVTELVARAMGGHSAGIFLHDSQTFEPLIVDGWHLNRGHCGAYKEYCRRHDVRYQLGKYLPMGTVETGSQISPRGMLLAGEIYHDMFVEDRIEDLLTCVLVRSERYTGHISVLYPDPIDGVALDKLRFMARLAPVLCAAMDAGLQLRRLTTQLQEARNTLDHVAHGIATVDSDGRILDANRAACLILTADDGLEVCHGRIHAMSRSHDAQLRAAISGACGRAIDCKDPMYTVLGIPRPSGKRPYGMVLRTVSHEAMDFCSDRGICAIHISDPESEAVPSVELLQRHCGLTPSEARLAAAVAAGKTLNDYADETQLSINTVRWTLKQVMAKTDCQRQADLVKLLTNLAINLPTDTLNV